MSEIKSPSDQLRDAWQDGPYGSVVLYGADLLDEQVKTINSLRSDLEEARMRIGELERKLEFRANVTDASGEFTEGLIARNEAFEFALTPSEETKFTYMGDVSFWHTDLDEDGNEHRIRLDVPWTSIKVLMKLIRQKADALAAHRAMIKAEKEQGE